MYKESMSIPLFSRFVFLFDFLVCVLYLYTIAYLWKNEGTVIFSLSHLEILFFVAIALTGAVIDPFLLFGKPSFVFMGYLLLITGLIPFGMGLFQTSKMYTTMPQAIPVLSSFEDLFKQTAILRAGFTGLYLVSLLKISIGYKSYVKRQQDQKRREASGKGMGAIHLTYKPKTEVRSQQNIQDKPKRTKLNVILFLTFMMIIIEVSLFLFDPKFNAKVGENISKSLARFIDIIQKASEKARIKLNQGINNEAVDTKKTLNTQSKINTNTKNLKKHSSVDDLNNVFKFFENTGKITNKKSNQRSGSNFKNENKILARYLIQIEQKIKISLSPKNEGKPVTLNDAVLQICNKVSVPYLDSKINVGNQFINMTINSSNAKASDLIKLLAESAGLNYGLCVKGLYLKEKNQAVNLEKLDLYRK